MNPYPKKILSTTDMIQKYTDAELQLPDESTLSLEETLNQVGFYRLCGYSIQASGMDKKDNFLNFSNDSLDT